jgi:hypothetical protein
MDTCASCTTTEDLRRCTCCQRWVCRAHAGAWPMYKLAIEWRKGECWPCAVADARRIIAEARALAGTIEPAPPFDD